MRLWRLSSKQHAQALDGGYGLSNDGRWNTAGRPVTYCATSPSLCVLEKLVHIEDPGLMPEFMMVQYELPQGSPAETVSLQALPGDWRENEALTQTKGDDWHRSATSLLLFVPSAIVPVEESPDLNAVINHTHPDAGNIRIRRTEPFQLDVRLFFPG
jgi:RES domain-containing protein